MGERETIERGKGGWGERERERERDEIIALLVVCCHSGQMVSLSRSLSLSGIDFTQECKFHRRSST